MTKITIIGAGELGQALGKILAKDSHHIVYWDCDEAKMIDLNQNSISLPEALAEAEFIFLCVPSWRVKEFLAFARPYWPRQAIIIFLSKGLDGQTGKLSFEIGSKLLPPGINWVVGSGAMIAEEIRTGRSGACLISSKSGLATEKVVNLFRGTNILALPALDYKGVVWSGVLKNIYALGLGMAEGVGWTLNERGILFARSTEEIIRLIKILGGKKETFLAAPTLADFVSTSFDNYSLNHQAGVEIGQTGHTEKKSEGLMSLAPFIDRLGKRAENFPILNNLVRVIIGHEDPRKVFEK